MEIEFFPLFLLLPLAILVDLLKDIDQFLLLDRLKHIIQHVHLQRFPRIFKLCISGQDYKPDLLMKIALHIRYQLHPGHPRHTDIHKR